MYVIYLFVIPYFRYEALFHKYNSRIAKATPTVFAEYFIQYTNKHYCLHFNNNEINNSNFCLGNYTVYPLYYTPDFLTRNSQNVLFNKNTKCEYILK